MKLEDYKLPTCCVCSDTGKIMPMGMYKEVPCPLCKAKKRVNKTMCEKCPICDKPLYGTGKPLTSMDCYEKPATRNYGKEKSV
jgi:hypothetical protein